jgi:predicted SnoaL-like aldol condensation-catalyzing enzyme
MATQVNSLQRGDPHRAGISSGPTCRSWSTRFRFDAAPWVPLSAQEQEHVFWAGVVQLHPESRGWVELKSADPREVAAVTLNILAEEADREQMRARTAHRGRIYNTRPMADLIAGEKTRARRQSDEELDAFIRASCYVAQHPTGTCAMGMGNARWSIPSCGSSASRAARRRRLGHADRAGRQHQPAVHHDRREGGRPDQGQSLPASRACGMSRTAQEEANRKLVLDMFEQVLNPMDSAAVDRFISPDYIQHNQSVEPGVASLKAFLDMIRAQTPEAVHDVKRAFVDGDHVTVHYSRAPLAGGPGLGGDRHLPGRGWLDCRALGRDAGRDRGRAQPELAFLGGPMRYQRTRSWSCSAATAASASRAARAFAAEGGEGADHRAAPRNTRAAEAELPGSKSYRADIADLKQMDEVYARIAKADKRIDVLYINAGIGGFAPLRAITEDAWDQVHSVNLKGCVFALQKALPLMGRGGSVVVTGSIGAHGALEGNGTYAAAKAGLYMAMKVFAKELVRRGHPRQRRQSGADRHPAAPPQPRHDR